MSGSVLNASKPGVYTSVWDVMLVSTVASVPGDVRWITTTAVDSTTKCFNACTTPTTASTVSGHFCVALDTCAAGATGRFRIEGQVLALNGAGTDAIGTLMAATDAASTLTAASNQKAIARMQEVGVANTLKMVEFSGWHGFAYPIS